MLSSIRLAVFDMAGTTVRDNDEVLYCFQNACTATGITAGRERLNALMGVSKLEVFHTLWREQLGPDVPLTEIQARADDSFLRFRQILEDYYRHHPIAPMPGARESFAWLRGQGVKVALNTGFYRQVTDIILQGLGWDAGLDASHRGGPDSLIDFSITSDEVPQGRPAPFMIRKAMETFSIGDPLQVIKIGDTPVDLLEGKNAGCRLNLGVCNGTHTREELAQYENDGLLEDLYELRGVLR